jgi:hypothetical protein
MGTRADIIVSLYCSEDHISSEANQWVDSDYRNRLNPDEIFGMSILPVDPTQPLSKPSELTQASYVSVGK